MNDKRRDQLMSVWLFLILMVLCAHAPAQGTALTYQGKLTDTSNPANGQYDFQFKLFNTTDVGTGTQQGATFSVTNLAVTVGIFTAQLDFGACASCFDGTARYLEIAFLLIEAITLKERERCCPESTPT